MNSSKRLLIIDPTTDIITRIRNQFPQAEINPIQKAELLSLMNDLCQSAAIVLDLNPDYASNLVPALLSQPGWQAMICMAPSETKNKCARMMEANASATPSTKPLNCDLRAIKPVPKKLSILMAEDNVLNQQVAVSLLEMRGHAVRVVENGRQVVEVFQKGRYDLIMMDIQMPEMDGLEATRQIRDIEKRQGGHIPIVAVTAFSMKTDRDNCLNAGMDAYLTKPLIQSELFNTIETVFHRTQGHPPVPPADKKSPDIFNIKTLLDIAGGKKELVKELINLFFDNIHQPLDDIRQGLQGGDSEKIRFGAHTLKGMGLNLSAGNVAKAAAELEQLGKNRLLTQAEAKLAELEGEIVRLRNITLPISNE